MYKLNKPYLTNSQGGIFLDKLAYQKVLEALEILKSIGATQQTLTELFDHVAIEKERQTLTYKNKVFLAIVPIEDVEVIEQLENCIDNADVDDALQEEGESLNSTQVDKILGW